MKNTAKFNNVVKLKKEKKKSRNLLANYDKKNFKLSYSVTWEKIS